MNRPTSILFFITLFSLAAFAQSKPVSNDAKEVFATVSRWADAVRDRDVKALADLFAEDAIITPMDGHVRGKAEELAALKPIPNLTFVSIVNEDIGVKLFTDVAVVTGLTKMRFASGGKESSVDIRFTAVFAKKDGRWQIVALQAGQAPRTTK